MIVAGRVFERLPVVILKLLIAELDQSIVKHFLVIRTASVSNLVSRIGMLGHTREKEAVQSKSLNWHYAREFASFVTTQYLCLGARKQAARSLSQREVVEGPAGAGTWLGGGFRTS